jgi:hypothetical protein
LVEIAERYVGLSGQRSSGYLALADGTGFSLPTVDFLFARQRDQHPEFRDRDFWDADNLFSRDIGPLTDVVDVLGQVPELHLGRRGFGQFDPEFVAHVLRDWVNGDNIGTIGDRWFGDDGDTHDKRVRNAGTYIHSQLVGQVPWGVSAIQRLALTDEALADVAHISPMIFYGVRSRTSALLRMAGIPRVAAGGLAALWDERGVPATSFADVRDWIAQLGLDRWATALPRDASMTGADVRSIWRALSGQAVGA